jgi:hypothetical protein
MFIGSIKEDENESCLDNEDLKEDTERIFRRELHLMDPKDACKSIINWEFEKRGRKLAKSDG